MPTGSNLFALPTWSENPRPCPVKKISLVIPIYNEAENITPLYQELCSVLPGLQKEYEIIFVDDCSQDRSLEILEAIFHQDPQVQVVSLLGNQGQTLALNAGFKQASGDVVIAMDGDGQHNPSYLPQFVQAIEAGYDLASSWKQTDQGHRSFRSFVSKTVHGLIGAIMKTPMKYFGATMKAYRTDILRHLDLSGDLHRFAGALVYYQGIRVKEIPIEVRTRKGGKSNYSLKKSFRVLPDMILIKFLTRYAKTPFRIFGTMGLCFELLGLMSMAYIAFEWFAFGVSVFRNTALVVVTAMCVIVGIQLTVFGLVSEMISRVYYTSKNREMHTIKEHLKH